MFERYTEKARRTIFFARSEASQFGSQSIESEHLLLGILREHLLLGILYEHGPSTGRLIHARRMGDIRREIERRRPPGPSISTSVDLPLSQECKRALAFAAHEAQRLGHVAIGNEHLLVGLLMEEKCLASEILRDRGINLEAARKDLAQIGSE
jgi:ATP-dependent Clp protease ATP-binding subunit ClpC